MKKWTWEWLAIIGRIWLMYNGIAWAKVELQEPIPVFYDYPYSDVALVKKGGDNALHSNHFRV